MLKVGGSVRRRKGQYNMPNYVYGGTLTIEEVPGQDARGVDGNQEIEVKSLLVCEYTKRKG